MNADGFEDFRPAAFPLPILSTHTEAGLAVKRDGDETDGRNGLAGNRRL